MLGFLWGAVVMTGMPWAHVLSFGEKSTQTDYGGLAGTNFSWACPGLLLETE
jgi:hypothetical protein